MNTLDLCIDEEPPKAGKGRCANCHEILEHQYCYQCDGLEARRDSIRLDLGELLELRQYISYVELNEDTWEYLYE